MSKTRDQIGDIQFHVMCEMCGVDRALEALKTMGMTATDEQVEAERQKETAAWERWENSMIKPKEDA